MKKRYSLLIIIAALIWSIDAFVRRELRAIPAPALVTIEYCVRLLILLPWVPRFLPEYKKMKAKDWWVMLGVGVISGTIGVTLFTAALGRVDYISYSVVALLQQTQPIFAVLLAVLILKERITKRFAVFGILALTASYFLAFPEFKPTFLGNGGELTAAALALGAAAAWGSGTVLSKLMLSRLSYMATAILRFAITAPTALLISLVTGQTYSLAAITSNQFWLILFIAVFGGIASFMLYYKGLQKTEAKVSTFAELTYPLTAAIIGFSFLGERLTFVQILAGAILLVDILVISLGRQE
ncbi:MAG: DMT superfamily drug/metabolite permease [Candidatus Beckwithbacteria bacterium GW2011_GWB1_47_15]|uniref:DMT superfamily drug/metabolite permease n=1 Tax=Candidatus Beckwithbacteria bacterium GW2011_GWB1_47_15 TaxID=1618371 RepID=A0A0G1U3V1_9BACT|nr:MAG: DMT superfamily drug/metabolite permease [Candidatus Beckwithbacteria bacterium GW2011_GWC1_49_16]KKU35759.1 MAG: DMT superfamily drug/metabolite permease [Candidatus Beckwithbacteria bacterium GW2011_GWA1_46_30]KKU61013.1 MAG: DMT superfamily drug/metabolite permease [Candidatus Beckwithbacteria bacterium GW2011_GWB1_47_15]KKU72318.1 MAG: DMT superfamily drug/metabolite permease [Candidatus Beckwithbacteria bacterium GW2011_GWA2_47_25]KKW04922.1 MAG: DMT superfamily drug/metabolite per